MATGTLTFSFTETIDISTFIPQGITLLDSSAPSERHMLQHTGTILTDTDGPIIELRLDFYDFTAVKEQSILFSAKGQSHIIMNSSTIIDMSYNSIVTMSDGEAVLATNYYPDNISPNLINFTLNLTSHTISLTFDESVDPSEFVATAITLHNTDVNVSLGRSYTIDGVAGSEVASLRNLIVTFGLTDTDVYELKAFDDFATSIYNTFLSCTSSLITDTARVPNRATPINASDPLMASAVYTDTIRPELLPQGDDGFELFDLSNNRLILKFNEPVNISSIDFSKITLYSGTDTSTAANYTLTGGVVTYVEEIDRHKRDIQIALSRTDLYYIKINSILATTRSNTYIQLYEGAIEDMAGVQSVLSPVIRTAEHLEDTRPPIAQNCSIDMNTGLLLITFDDVMEPSSLVIQEISIQRFRDISDGLGDTVTLEPADISDATNSTAGYDILVFIPLLSLNAIKANPDLAVDSGSSYLVLPSDSITDIADVHVTAITSDAGLQCTHTPDYTQPELTSFNLDMDGVGRLTLSFSETVNPSTLLVSEIMLIGLNNETHTIQSMLFAASPPRDSIDITIGRSELNIIKSLPNLASVAINTNISVSSIAVQDMNGNNLTAVDSMNVNVFSRDGTSPQLESFTLNMNTGVLSMSFSETINGSSFDPTQITLRSDSSDISAVSHTLTGGYWEKLYQDSLNLSFTIDDLNELKRLIGLADEKDHTFISITSNTLNDMNSDETRNPIIGISLVSALIADDFTADVTRPNLVNFTLNLTSEVLILTFDETVNASSLNIVQFILQSDYSNETVIQSFNNTNVSSGDYSSSGFGGMMDGSEPVVTYVQLTFGTENSSYTHSSHSTIITINLGPDDLNSLKKLTDLATEYDNTYLSLSSSAINDMNRNPVVPFHPNASLQVGIFYNDFVRPELIRFDIDLAKEELYLTFSEVVNGTSLDVTQLTISSTNTIISGTQIRTLTSGINGSTASSIYDTVITVSLGINDLNEIKRLTNLAISSLTTYLNLTSSTVVDMNNNPVLPRTIRTTLYTPDNIKPRLTAFNIDMNEGILHLEFSETVKSSTLNVTQITLQEIKDNTGSLAESYTLTRTSITSDPDGRSLAIIISRVDRNMIKFLSYLAQDEFSTYLSLTELTVEDMNDNLIVPINVSDAIRVSTYISDITGPYLLSFELDLDSEILTLHFDETVNVSSFIFPVFTILSPNVTSYNLTGGKVLGINDPDVDILLNSHDLNQIKLDTDLATSINNTYLSMKTGGVQDMAFDPNNAFDVSSLHAIAFTPDRVRPNLTSFFVDLTLEVIVLNFDEAMNASSFDPTGLTLLNSPSGSSFSLTGGNTSSDNGLSIIVHLTASDLNEIKYNEILYVNASTSWLAIHPFTIADMNQNLVNLISISDPLNTTSFNNDTTSPRLRAFDLDLDTNQLTLIFTETVNTRSIEFSEITFQDHFNSSNQYSLTDGILNSYEDSTHVYINLTRSDLNEIKGQRIALFPATTYLTISEDLIIDQNDQPVIPRDNGINSLHVRSYVFDMTPPILENFTLNMTSELLVLSFSETVNVYTLNVSGISIISDSLLTETHTLGIIDNVTGSDDVYTPIVTIKLGNDDLNVIKSLRLLATNSSNTYLTINTTCILDMKTNPVVPITSSNPLLVSEYTEDSIQPVLNEYDLDMNTGEIRLLFSETVDPLTFDISQFSLQSTSLLTDSTQYHTLTGAIVPSDPLPSLTITLTDFDLNRIKQLIYLATSVDDTYLALDSSGLQDMALNFVTSIPEWEGLRVRFFTEDKVNPLLVSYDLNLQTERLSLLFSETVNADSLAVSSIIIQSGAYTESNSTELRRFIGGSVLSDNDTLIEIQLNDDDLNYIKSIPTLGTERDDTYIVLESSLIDDMNDNDLVAIVNGNATQVNVYTPDDVDPVLVAFDFDLNEGQIHLTFNETINGSSIDVTQFTLHDDGAIPTSDYYWSLTTGSYASRIYWPIVTIYLSDDDLNEIKRQIGLAISNETTYLSITSSALIDMNNNSVIPTTLSVSNFTDDVTDPYLTSFTLDNDEGILYLTFSETVDVSSIDTTQITLQSNRVLLSSSLTISSVLEEVLGPHDDLKNTTSYFSLTGGELLTERDGVSLSIRITVDNLNSLKALTQLATTTDDTFIVLTNDTITDMSNNSLVLIPDNDAVNASRVIPDTTDPILDTVDIDLNTGVLSLTFNETVAPATLNFETLIIQDRPNRTSLFTFSESSLVSVGHSTIVTVTFSKNDLDRFKRNRLIGTGSNDTYISVSNTTIFDMNDNPLVAIGDLLAIEIDNYTRDSTPPQLERFDLDVDSGLLTLYYSETVDILYSFEETEITLQSSANLSESFHWLTLTGGERILNDSTVAYLILNTDDLNEIKRLTHVGTCVSDDTYISISSDQISDMSYNEIDPVTLNVTQCIEDTTRPQLVNYTLNMHNSSLTLTFDETVDSNSLRSTQITFLNNYPLNESQSYQLTGGSITRTLLSGRVVVVLHITNDDLNELKRRELLSTNITNTFIEITSDLILDMNQNQNVEINGTDPLQVQVFIEDLRPPELLSFDFNLTSELLTLSFSETVDASSLDLTSTTIQNNDSSLYRVLTGGYVLTPSEGGSEYGPDDPVLIIRMSSPDLNYIKSIRTLGTDINDTYISVDESLLVDMNDNRLTSIDSSLPLMVDVFTPDAVRPVLIEFDIDMNAGVIYLTFSETVDVSSLSVSQLTIQDGSYPDQSLSFTPGNTSFTTFSVSPDWPEIEIQIGSIDLNEIKRLTQLAISTDSTYLTLTQDLVNDMNENQVVPVMNDIAIGASNFTPDTTEPILLSFEISMDSGEVRLTFSETVDVSTLDLSSITLQSNESDPSVYWRLVDGNVTNSLNSTIVVFYFDIDDFNMLKKLRGLATDTSNTFITIDAGGIADMNRNPVTEINSTKSLRADSVESDITDPRLVEFDLDMNTGQIYLTFDETVEASSLRLTEITLQNDTDLLTTYTLTGGISTMEDSTVIIVNISFFDLNEIKKLRMLATSDVDTFITLTNLTLVDMNDNYITSLPSGLMVSVFTNDTTPPELISFILDLNSGNLTLEFTETVDTNTFDITAFTLQSSSNASESIDSYNLGTPYLLTGDEVIIVQLLQYTDFNTFKSKGELGTLTENTFLTITDLAITDMIGNPVNPIESEFGLKALKVIPDMIQPELESFDLDMDQGTMTLTFSETVNTSTLDVSQIVLLNNYSQMYILTEESSYSISPYWTIITIVIGATDLNAIKYRNSLAISNETTFLELSIYTIKDTSNNSVVGVDVPLQVRVFTPDQTSPSLVSFELDLSLDILTLTFNETIDASSIDPTQLTLLDNSTFIAYNLTGGENVPLLSNGTVLMLKLNFVDRNAIKLNTDLATSINDTFIAITSLFIRDMNGNAISPIDTTQPLQADDFTPDYTPPYLLKYELDMNSPLLRIYFSETVDVSTLNVSDITLQGEREYEDNSTQSHTLVEGLLPLLSQSLSENGDIIEISIGESDSNAIKFYTSLATSFHDTYLSFPSSLIQDMNGNDIVPIDSSNATQVHYYNPDQLGPVLRNFTLNLTSELLILTFDETVNFDSVSSTRISVQGSPSYSDPIMLRKAVTIGPNSHIMTINLTASPEDLSQIKLDTSTATIQSNAYISLVLGAVTDNAGNPSVAITLVADEFYHDAISPRLISFSANINASTLSLTFDEVVDSDTFNPTSITLQNAQSASVSNSVTYTLTGGSTFSENGHVIVVDITRDDLNQIKRLESLFTGYTDSYISITSSLIKDMNSNPVQVISPLDALNISLYIHDTTQPSVVGFDLDMNLGVLTIFFLETVNIHSINYSCITLQSGLSVDSDYYTLTGGSLVRLLPPSMSSESGSGSGSGLMSSGNVTSNDTDSLFDTYVPVLSLNETRDQTAISINITLLDLNSIKSLRIAEDVMTSWLSLNPCAIIDQEGLPAQRLDPINVRDYTPDITPPVLQEFDLDMNTGLLTLHFSETVMGPIFDSSQITIQSDDNLTFISSDHTLNNESISLSGLDPVITVKIGVFDLNELKRLIDLAISPYTTFISITSMLVSDTKGNRVVEILPSDALPVTEYTSDTSRPHLVSFSLNLVTDILSLTFNETVSGNTMDETRVFLLEREDVHFVSQRYQLIGSPHDVFESTVINVYLSFEDANNIKNITNIATYYWNTYLSFDRYLINDTNSNPVVPISNASAIRVSLVDYRPDSVAPLLTNFSLNLSSEILSLSFSETVNVATLNLQDITLLNEDSSSLLSLTGGSILSPNRAFVDIKLNQNDLNYIKARRNFSTNLNNTLISFPSSMVKDTTGNDITLTTGTEVNEFYSDLIPPVLLEYTLDLTSESLILTFSEVVDTNTLDATLLTLQQHSDLNNSLHSYALTGGVVPNGYETIITIQFTTPDLNSIKELFFLATSSADTYISYPSSFIQDMNYNWIIPSPPEEAKLVDTYIRDNTPPVLLNYTLDINAEIMTFTFSESINVESFDIASIVLQNQLDDNTVSISLTSGKLSSFNDTTVQLVLSLSDVNNIKRTEFLATNHANIFLSQTNLVKDMAGNVIVPIPVNDAKTPSFFQEDTINPVLDRFDMDLDEGLITLHFNETVDVRTLQLTDITFQSDYNASDVIEYDDDFVSFTLTGGSTISTNEPLVPITITRDDLNEIKKLDVCRSSDECYITFPMTMVYDMIGLPVVQVFNFMAQNVSNFTFDTTPPVLIEFSQIDLVNGTISLFFSETINVETFDFSTITLLSYFKGTPDSFQLTGGTINSENGTNVTISLLSEDIIGLKTNDRVCSKINNCWLTVTSDTVLDMNQNNVVQIDQLDALYACNFIDDDVPPYLVDYTLDMDTGFLNLTFDEPVRPSTLDPTQIYLLPSPNSSTFVTLTRYTTTESPIGVVISLNLSTTDINNIKATEYIKSPTDTYLAFTSEAIYDVAMNPVTPLGRDQPQSPFSYTADSTSPECRLAIIDLSQETLQLVFDEPIRPSVFDATQVTLLSSPYEDQPVENLTLSGGIINSRDGSHLLTLIFNKPDNKAIKLNDDLATSRDNAYVSLSGRTLTDMSGVYEVPEPFEDPLQVTVGGLVSDTSQATLYKFNIDMNSGELTLTFTDVIVPATLHVTSVVLQSGSRSIAPNVYRLTTVSSTTSPPGCEVLIKLGRVDLNGLKYRTGLTTDINDSYITVGADVVNDLQGTDIIPITNDYGIKAESYIPDTTHPQLESFSLNLNAGSLTLNFSETVNASTLNVSGVVLLNSAGSSSIRLSLMDYPTGSETQSDNGASLIVMLGSTDLNEIKRLTDLGTTVANTFIEIDNGSIYDMVNLPNKALPSSLQAQSIINDTTQPELVSFHLNLTEGWLYLTFSETVNSHSLNVNNVNIKNTSNTYANIMSLNSRSGTGPISLPSTEVIVQIGRDDLNDLKRDRSIATFINNTFMSLQEEAIRDMSGNYNKPVYIEKSIRATTVFEDLVQPYLLGFIIDLDSGELILTFDETVETDTLLVSGITLQSVRNDSDISNETDFGSGSGSGFDNDSISVSSWTLTPGRYPQFSSTLSADDPVITVLIGRDDLNEIKRLIDLATSVSNTYIVLSSDTIMDMNNNELTEIDSTDALQATSVLPDITPPILERFDLNLNTGVLRLTFNETVESMSLLPTGVILQSSVSPSLYHHTLTSGTVLTENYIIVDFKISIPDLNVIKSLPGLATGSADTYLRLTYGAIQDMSTNKILSTDAFKVSQYINDTTRPNFVSFDLDLDSDTLTLTFDETINSSSLLVNGLTLRGSSGQYRQLRPPTSTQADVYSTSINISLSRADSNEIKRLLMLATGNNDTYLSLTALTIDDMNENPVNPISAVNAYPVNVYTVDDTRPKIENFTLDLDSNQLILTFDETVRATSLDPKGIIIHSMPLHNEGLFRRLTGGRVINDNSHILTLQLSNDDKNFIKLYTDIGTFTNNTYLTIEDNSVYDLSSSSNGLNGSSIMASLIIPDHTDPRLIGFAVNLNTGRLILTFNEPVNSDTFNPVGITLQNSQRSRTGIRLSNATTHSSNGLMLVVSLTEMELNEIKRIDELLISIDTSFITGTAELVRDMNGNSVVPVRNGFAIQANGFIPDSNIPSLLRYSQVHKPCISIPFIACFDTY